MSFAFRPFTVAALVAGASLAAAQECPQFSTGFARPHSSGTALALAVHDDGTGAELYVGEQSGIERWNGRRWNVPGAPLAGAVRALASANLGSGPQLFAGGEFNPFTSPRFLACWNGAAWLSIPGQVDGAVHALAAFDDGHGPELFVAGQFNSIGGVPFGRIVAWNGTSWRALGDGLSSVVFALAVHDDGSGPKLCAGGQFASAGGVPASNVAAWDGTSWRALGDGANGAVRALASFEGRLYAGGEFTTAGAVPASRVASWDGSAWSVLGSGADGTVRAFGAFDDGFGARLLVCGDFAVAGGTRAGGVAQWDGSAWSATSPQFVGRANAIATYDEGSGPRAFVGGPCRLPTNLYSLGLMRWDGLRWSAIGDGFSINSEVVAVAGFDDGSGFAVYAGGSEIYDSGDGYFPRLAKYANGAWSGIDMPQDGGILDMDVLDDGTGPALYLASGHFDGPGFPHHDIARYRNGVWEPLGGDLDIQWTDLAMFDFGSGRQLVAINFDGVLRWDGVQWSPVGPPVTAFRLAVFDDGSGPALYCSGYTEPSGANQNFVARWDGAGWTTLATFAGRIACLEVLDVGDGPALYAGGNFLGIIGAGVAANLVRFDGSAWTSTGPGLIGPLQSLASFDDGSGSGNRLYAFGLGSGAFQRLDGTVWTSAAVPSLSSVTNDVAVVHPPGGPAQMWLGGRRQILNGVELSCIGVYEACPATGELYCFGDGTSGACPCGNESGVGEDAGCRHSFGGAGALRASGHASLADDTLVLAGNGMTESSALYFQAATRTGPVPFGDGLKCTAGPFIRLRTQVNSSGASSYPASGDPSISVRGAITSPATRHYQVRYRNAASFCTPEAFNYTNAVAIAWQI